MPDSVEYFLHVEECHIGFSPLVVNGLDGLLQNEDKGYSLGSLETLLAVG